MKKLFTLAALCLSLSSVYAGPGAPGNNPDFVLKDLPNGDMLFMHYDTRDELFGRFGGKIKWRLPLKNFARGEEVPSSFELIYGGTSPDYRVFVLQGETFAELRSMQNGQLIARFNVTKEADQTPISIGYCQFSPDSTRLAVQGRLYDHQPNPILVFNAHNGALLQRVQVPDSISDFGLTWKSPTQLQVVYRNPQAYPQDATVPTPGVPVKLTQIFDVPVPPSTALVTVPNDTSVIPVKPTKLPTKKKRRTSSKRPKRR